MDLHNTNARERRLSDRLYRKKELRLLILDMLDLPMLPALMNSILRISNPGTARTTELAEVISTHTTLAGNILRIANSDFFGDTESVSAIPRAIKTLGYEGVRSLAVSELVLEAAARKAVRRSFDSGRFRTHSLACAYLSQKIAAMTNRADRETIFVCGLLHDIGKPFISMCFPASYGSVFAHLEEGGLTSIQSEDDILGLTHIEVGMWLAQHWNFSKAVVFAIANHHGVAEGDDRYNSLASILRVADHICLEEQISLEKRAFVEPLENVVLEELKLSVTDLLELRRELAAEKMHLESLA